MNNDIYDYNILCAHVNVLVSHWAWIWYEIQHKMEDGLAQIDWLNRPFTPQTAKSISYQYKSVAEKLVSNEIK